jgi:hypothetical protein
MSDPPASHANNVGKWDSWYANLSVSNQGPVLYANAVTYLMAAAFLADVDEIEDWGCGGGGFRRFCLSRRYVGLDGSKTPFADKIVDLCTYRSNAPRHRDAACPRAQLRLGEDSDFCSSIVPEKVFPCPFHTIRLERRKRSRTI